MKFETYLAFRYFKGTRKGARFLSFIKAMSITGVAIGSAGLLIALSIVHGFKSTINDKVLGFAPHVLITNYTDAPLYRADTLMTYLDRFEEIETKQIINQGQVMIQTKDGVTGTELRGVDQNSDVSNLTEYVVEGSYNLSKKENGYPGIVVGSKLAQTIRAELGSIITVYTISGTPSLANSPEIQQFELTGIFRTGIDFFDGIYAVTAKEYTDKLFGIEPSQGQGVEIKLKDSSKILAFDKKLEDALPFPYYKQTIQSRYGNIFAWVELQEQMIPLVISVMIIVAAFNLIGTILMMVLERTKDIGILKTIGSKSSIIRKVFLLEGLMVASIGLIIGIAISLLFAWLQINYQIIPLSEENYYMSYAPVEPHLLDFVITSIVTIVLCALASWLPARIAAKTDPLKVISYGR
ncbi:MAG: ABC transporter permease [Balneolaceae bacterium]|nr:ABC transporter permease [Balneolaceae bacterium]MBO6547445.1 ABC transporter permease [Balneolaceae bacterium]MBO6647608.1 ABC transporter permease [Balneolaceae bacterium]